MMERTTTLSSRTTGFLNVLETARIADSPGLMIAVKFSTSSMPILDIENVLPVISSGVNLPARAFEARSWARTFNSASINSSALRMTGTTKPCSSETATPRCTWLFQRVVVPSVELFTSGKSFKARTQPDRFRPNDAAGAGQRPQARRSR